MLMFYKAKRIKELERENETLKATVRNMLKENEKFRKQLSKHATEKITIAVELEGTEEVQKKLEAIAETAKATFAEVEKLNVILENAPEEESEGQTDDRASH